MRSTNYIITIVTACVVASLAGWALADKPVAFEVTIETHHINPETGARVLAEVRHIAKRSDGARAETRSVMSANGEVTLTVREIDKDGNRYRVYPSVGAVSSEKGGGRKDQPYVRRATCDKPIKEGRKPRPGMVAEREGEIAGYAVQGYVNSGKIGTMVIWKAPALGCESLGFDALDKDGKLISVGRAVKVETKVGPQAFEIPAGFQEMSPTEVAEAINHKHDLPKCSTEAEQLKHVQEKYDRAGRP